MHIRKLTDEDLLASAAKLAAEERRITLDILLHLKEIERRRLHLDRGYSSLYEYTLKELKYSEGAAYRRVQAMRLLKDLPEVETNIVDGSLNITNAAKIQAALRHKPIQERASAIQALLGKSGKEVEQQLAPVVGARETTRWLTPDSVELKFQLAKDSFQNLEELKAIKSNSPKFATYGGLVTSLIELGQERWNPIRRTASTQRRNGALINHPDPRHIANSLRIQVWRRDQNQCTYTNPQTGQRCTAKHYLHIDHILPVALGGKAEPQNLRLLCAQHNQRRAEKPSRIPKKYNKFNNLEIID